MISVEEAKRLLLAHAPHGAAVERALGEANGHVLAQDVHAPHDHPLFDCSAVDGYAFAFGSNTAPYRIVGTVPAGSMLPFALRPGECARIFTGAALPAGADTAVMQELCGVDGDQLHLRDTRLQRGGNVRFRGEQLRAGTLALPRGSVLNAAAIGLLASLGVRRVDVVTRPHVALVITGDEFTQADPPEPGRIFNSNDVMLQALLAEHGIGSTVIRAADDPARLRAALEEAIHTGDVVVTTGGASVGDHDLVMPVLREMDAMVHFHTVAQKPGKPMLYATCNTRPVVGLPGNPRAVLVLMHAYVLPLLRAMQGAADVWPRSAQLPLAEDLHVKGDRAEFRAALVRDGRVVLPPDEGSHMLRSLVGADALAYLPADIRAFRAGDPVEVHYLLG